MVSWQAVNYIAIIPHARRTEKPKMTVGHTRLFGLMIII